MSQAAKPLFWYGIVKPLLGAPHRACGPAKVFKVKALYDASGHLRLDAEATSQVVLENIAAALGGKKVT